MDNKWLKLLLAASLAFNVAFAAPLLYDKFTAKQTPTVKKEITGNQLSTTDSPAENRKSQFPLSKEQKKSIDVIIKKFKLEMLNHKQEILAKRIEIVDEMGDPDFDQESIKTRTGELNALENKLNLLFIDTLMNVDAILSPAQRLEFLYKLSKNWFFIDNPK
ncbi:MAG: periplasmic heavy metal sensor [bacterium]|nr:periplasmic heavy metal sensor [bacterium]